MGVCIEVQDEQGEALSDMVCDTQNLLRRILPDFTDKSFACLRFIDPYGNTVFNILQMDAVIDELDRLADAHTGKESQTLLGEIRKLAEFSKKHPHQYLVFIGD